jgi:alkylhydroperoxidase family enzyme
MARIPYAEDTPANLVESQRPDSLPEEYGHIDRQAARNVYRSVAHEPEVVRTLRAYIGATWNGSGLSDRERELLILAVARALDSSYEWHQHVRIGLLEGLTPEEMRAVAKSKFDRFETHERDLMTYAVVAADREVTEDDLDRLREHYDVADVAGITALVGAYVCLAVVLSAFDVETEEPFVGWDLAGLDRD